MYTGVSIFHEMGIAKQNYLYENECSQRDNGCLDKVYSKISKKIAGVDKNSTSFKGRQT